VLRAHRVTVPRALSMRESVLSWCGARASPASTC